MDFKSLASKLFPNSPAEDDFVDNEEYMNDEPEMPVRAAESTYTRSKSVNVIAGNSIEMKVVTPKSFESVSQIADLLVEKKTVLLNLENTNRETSIRLIDFLSGAAYALRGDVQKVADNTYAITPNNVAVSKGDVGGMPVAPSYDDSDDGALDL